MIKTINYGIKAIAKRGIGFLFSYFQESIWFDLRYGTKTSARVPKADQTIFSSNTEAEEGLLYVASFSSVVTKSVAVAKKSLGKNRFAEAQFVDLGCGKGKTLLVFGMYCKKEQTATAIGIEYDPILTEVAKENVAHCNMQNQIKIVNDSAVNLLDYIDSDTLIIYLYNSFQGETLRTTLKVLHRIPHILIYVDPAERNILKDYGYEIIHDVKGKYNANTYLVANGAAL